MMKKIVFILSSLVIGAASSCSNAKQCTVSFDTKGGTIIENQIVEKGDKVEKPTNPERNGYTFKNWTYKGEEWSFIGYVVTEDMTIESNWDIITYNITYDLAGGSISQSNPLTYTVEDEISLIQPTKEGYTFSGWISNTETTFFSIAKGTFGNLSLTASWILNTYTVTINTDELGTVTGSGTYPHGANVEIGGNPIHGYKLEGIYSDNNLVSESTPYSFEITENKTFEFKWVLENYTITYNLDGGKQNPLNPLSYTINDQILLRQPIKENYSFAGWFDENGSKVSTIQKGSSGNITLNAKWTANKYYVSLTTYYYSDKHIIVTGEGEYDYGSTAILSATLETGYKIIGWYVNNVCVSTEDIYSFVVTEDVDVKCKSDYIYYNINYNLNGGTFKYSYSTWYHINQTYELPTVEKTGYHFVRWIDEKGNTVTRIEADSIGDRTFTAIFEENTYNVNIKNSNQQRGIVEGPLTYKYNETTSLVAVPNDGYKFEYWEYNYFKSYNSNLKIKVTSNLTVYVSFIPIYYSISYNLNGGTGFSSNPTSYNIEQDTAIVAPSKSGYKFSGWIDQNGKSFDGITKGKFGDLILTAQWEETTDNVVVCSTSAIRGTVTGGGYYNVGEQFTLTATPNKGYEFVCWYKSGTKLSEKTTTLSCVKGSSNESYFAEFAVIHYSITYRATYLYDDGHSGYDYEIGETNMPKTYTIEDEFEFSIPQDPFMGYSADFDRWECDGLEMIRFNKGNTGNKLIYAVYKVKYKTLTLVNTDPSKGEIYGGGTFQIGSTVIFTANPIEGYRVESWRCDVAGQLWEFGSGNSVEYYWSLLTNPSDRVIEAIWGPVSYSITYKNLEGADYFSGATSYTIESNFLLDTPFRKGYTFVNWTDENNNVVDKISKGTTGNIVLTANWTPNSYFVQFVNLTKNMGSITSSGSYFYDSDITINAMPFDGYEFIGWFKDSNCTKRLSSSLEYKFKLDALGKVVYAKFGTKADLEEENKRTWNQEHGAFPCFNDENTELTYGIYPQTHISDASLLERLNKLTVCNEVGYYELDGEYYAKTVANPFVATQKYSDGCDVIKGQIDWFHCEPVKWKMLLNGDNKILLFSKSVLDAMHFQDYFEGEKLLTDYNGNSAEVFANNYQYSQIRTFLNTDFLSMAFNFNDSYLLDTVIDDVLTDKVFLLSSNEMISYGYCHLENKDITDYALAHFCVPYNHYWTRSAAYQSETEVTIHNENTIFVPHWVGNPGLPYSEGFAIYHLTESTGVCPAITISY